MNGYSKGVAPSGLKRKSRVLSGRGFSRQSDHGYGAQVSVGAVPKPEKSEAMPVVEDPV
jgi:hypothetical protein